MSAPTLCERQEEVEALGPLPYVLRTLPEPIAVILGGVGDGVDSFGTRLFPR
jgi:hypothetical protein